MALDTIYGWSQTAASNASADATINFAEFQKPSSLNDSCRALMARIAQFLSDAAPNRTSTSSSNVYAVASDAAGATLTNCEQITFIPDATNTSSCTLNVDGRGAKSWRPAPGVEFEAGNIIVGVPVTAYYRSSSDEWLSPGTGYYVSQSASGVALQTITARLPQIGDLVVSYAPTPGAGRIRLTESTQSLLKSDYPELNSYLSGISYPWGSDATHFSLPPAAGYFLRFAATSSSIDTAGARSAGATQADQNKAHTHAVSVTGTTNTTGAHTHTAGPFAASGSNGTTGGGGIAQTSTSSATTSNGDHSHTVSASGTAASDGGDEVRVKNVAFHVDVVASSAAAAAQIAVFGFPFQWDTGTTDATPGAGRLRINNATLASATYLYISNTDTYSVTLTGLYAAFTTNAVVNISKVGAQANRLLLYVTGTPTAGSGYYKIPVSVLSSAGSFSSNDRIAFEFSLTSADANVTAAAAQAAAAAASAVAAAASAAAAATTISQLPLNARNYGAVGNGTADDAAVLDTWLAACISAGRPGYLPAGNYRRSTDWSIDLVSYPNGFRLITDGWSTSKITMDSGKSVTIKNSGGAGVFYADIELHVVGNISGPLIRIGQDSLVDAFNHSHLRIQAQNASTNASNVGIRSNYTVLCTHEYVSNCSGVSHIGTAIEIKQSVGGRYVHSGGGNANIGWDINGANNYANTFICPDLEEVNTGVKITSGFKNTWIGPLFSICTNYGIDAVSGSENFFLNGSFSAVGATFNGTTGVSVVNGSDLVTKTATQTLTSKTLTTPNVNTSITVNDATASTFNLNAGSAAFQFQISNTGTTFVTNYFTGGAMNWQLQTGGVHNWIYNGAQAMTFDTNGINLSSGKVLKVNSTQVVAARDTGWTAMTNTTNKATAYDTTTVTLPQLASRVKALQDALATHGLIGA